MEKIVSKHKNLTVLAVVLFLQVLALGIQVKRPSEAGPVSLVKVWTIRTITPFQKALVHTAGWAGNTWRGYFYLRGVRAENERLENENMQLRMQQVRMVQDASQAQRLQALLKFKEQYISETVAAQVIGTSGSETSRVLFIDKGSNEGVKADMAVITPTGVVGKVMRVFPATSQVLEINDQTSGIGALLEKSRLQGILKGTAAGEAMLHYVMRDENVEVCETVVTSGGDRIFPKGLPVGTVIAVDPGKDMFLNIWVKPAARLDRVEEVLVITKINERQPELLPENPQRAADILASRLPSVPVKPPEAQAADGKPVAQPGSAAGSGAGPATVPVKMGTAVAPGAGAALVKPGPAGEGGAKPAATNASGGASAGGTAKTKPGPAGDGTGATKPGAPSVFVNGHGVMHVSDLPNGKTATPKDAGAQQKQFAKPAPVNPPQR